MDYQCKKCNRSFINAGALDRHTCYDQETLTKVLDLYKNGLSLRKISALGYSKKVINLAIKSSDRRNLVEAGRNAQKLYPFKHSDESKRKLSISASKWLRNSVHHPWRSKHESYPEKVLRQWLSNNLSRQYSIIQEHTPTDFDRNYRMDFAIIDLKLDIEVNGNAHYIDGRLKPYYLKRQQYIESKGWTIVNIHAREICREFFKVEQVLINFLEINQNKVFNDVKCEQQRYDKNQSVSDILEKNRSTIISMIDANARNRDICRRFGISYTSLKRFLRKNNIKYESRITIKAN